MAMEKHGQIQLDFRAGQLMSCKVIENIRIGSDERDVPAYIVFGDTSLREMARYYPGSVTELSGISGVGEKKLNEFGDTFLAAIRSYLSDHGKQSFDE